MNCAVVKLKFRQNKRYLLILLNSKSHPTGPVRAYDRCWFFGDEFCSRSFEQHFKQRRSTDYNGYVKAHFDVSGFFNNFTSDNPSLLGRLSGLMSTATSATSACSKGASQGLLPLPKIVVIVPENDIIKTIGDESGSTALFCKLLNFVMTEYDRCVATFKENLPAKCIKYNGYPSFLWIQAPMHENFTNNENRHRFNKALEDVVKMHTNSHTLELKKVWDPKDKGLYLDSQRFSVDGYKAYWEAIDKTVRYFDSIVLKRNEKKKVQKNGSKKFDQKDQF